MKRVLVVVMLVGAVGLLSPRAMGDDKKPDPKQPKGIDDATAAAWAERGFEALWVRQRDGNVWRKPNYPKDSNDATPALWYKGGKGTLTDETLKDLPPVEVPFALSTYGAGEVTDAGLKHLAGHQNLAWLTLGGAKVTGEGLKHLAGLKKLARLDLSNSRVPDDGLKELAALENLTALYLSSTPVTDEGLKHLAGLKNLTELSLFKTRVTDDGLAHLAGLKNLAKLYLDGTRITDAGLEPLAGLENLTTLSLRHTEVTGKNLKPLARLKKLNDLTLDHKTVTDQMLRTLSEMGLLHALHEAEAEADNGTGRRVGGDRRATRPEEVRFFYFNAAHATGEGVKYLAALPNLTTLVLGSPQVTPEGVKHAAQLPKLLVLHLASDGVTGEMLKPLAGHKTLARLGVPLTDGTVRALSEAGLLHLLSQAKGADGKRPASDDEIVSLDLSETRLKGEGLKYVGKLKNLTTLDLRRTPVANVWLEDFKRTLPKCVVRR